MNQQNAVVESMNKEDREAKEAIIALLIKEGYGTYAKRLREYNFLVQDSYKGHIIPVAAMFPATFDIVVNPSFFHNGEKIFKQLSVVVRHELLHFLLMHENRFIDHLKETDPDFEKSMRSASINDIANHAMDWDLSREGYDDEDKETVKKLTLNGRVLGGLVLDEDHPEWLDLTMEQMFDKLREQLQQEKEKAEQEKQKTTVTLHKATHSPEYVKAYNDAIAKYGSEPDDSLEQALEDLQAQLQAAI